MTSEEVFALAAQGEGETVDFKRSVAELDKVVETVSAFANTRGGAVLIGSRCKAPAVCPRR
jgi:predicted HTH transcriptional regulator